MNKVYLLNPMEVKLIKILMGHASSTIKDIPEIVAIAHDLLCKIEPENIQNEKR